MQGEVTTQNINKKPQIQAIRIPNKKEQIKLSQYADDSNFFLNDTKSIQSVLTCFDKLKDATGSTINLEKSTVLPINTNDTQTLKQTLTTLQIKQQYQTIEVLGIIFCEGLKRTTETNWQKILGKMENHIKKLASRQLSLYGKTIILNTLIMAKTTYLSNIFSLPTTTTTKIH